MADTELYFPSQYVINNILDTPFTFTVYHTDEQFTLQSGESVAFDICTYGEYTYYAKTCETVDLHIFELETVTYNFTDGGGVYSRMSKSILTDTTFVPFRENFTYTVKSGDTLIVPIDSLAKGAYYVNLGVGDVVRNVQSGSKWTGSGRGEAENGIVFAWAGQKTVDDKQIAVYKVYGEVPYLQADMYFEAGNRVYFSWLGGNSETITTGGTTVTYSADDYAFVSNSVVFVNPTGIVSVDVMSEGMGGEEFHNYYEFDFTSTTNQAPYEGLATVFVQSISKSGDEYTVTVLNQPAEGQKVVGKVYDLGTQSPITYLEDLSDWTEMVEDDGNWVLTDETPVMMIAYVAIAYVNEDNLAVAGGGGDE